MASFKPTMPFNVPMYLMVPVLSNVQGVSKKTWDEPTAGTLFYGSFRTFGGTEALSNDLYSVINTATIDTWFNPAITADCRVYLPLSDETFEILGMPENIQMRNQYMRVKVRKVGGVA